MRRKVDDDRNALANASCVLLVVEDDESFATILRDLSREMGFQSLVASTAEEALTLANQFMPSAIILDVGLPDQSGLSVLDRLKRAVQTRHIPIHVVRHDRGAAFPRAQYRKSRLSFVSGGCQADRRSRNEGTQHRLP
jgi:CheY-like chemotaxis protein